MEANSRKAEPSEPPSAADWRSRLPPDLRQGIVSKIMETLKRHLPISLPEGLNEIHKIAVQFEEKIFTAAISQPDYLQKISLKILSVESKTQNTGPSSTAMSQNPADTASIAIQPQTNNHAQLLPMSMDSQNPTGQPSFLHNIPNNASATVQNFANMSSALSSITGVNQSSLSSVGQTSNLQNMSGISQSTSSNSVGQNAAANVYANAQRQMQGGEQQRPIISQQQLQQQPHNQLFYQFQQQLFKQKLQQPSHLQPHLQQQQQQQQPLLQTTKLQSSQQSLMQMSSSIQPVQSSIHQTQPGAMQSTMQSGIHQNQLNSVQQSIPSMLHQHSQSVVRKQHQAQSAMHQQNSLQQQPTSILQQSSLQLKQDQQLLIGQQASIADMHHQPQRISVQQNNLLINVQQSQQMLNQQNISLHQQQQLGPQNNNISAFQQQQQQLLGSFPSVSSNMQPNQHPMHILQKSKTSVQQQQQLQSQQASMSGLQPQVRQSQHQSSQQQLVTQFGNQSTQLQQHLTMQQHQSFLPGEMQQRLQASGAMLSQNAIDQHKQFVQPERGLPEVSSSTSMDSTAQTGHGTTDWQEEAYQKIKSMKDLYFTDINELCQKVSMKLQQFEDHLSAPKQSGDSGQYDKIKNFKTMLDRTLQILELQKGSIQLTLKDKLPLYEKKIVSILALSKKKAISSQPPGHQQVQHSGGLLAQQSSQVHQLQQHDIHANHVQQMKLHASSASMQSSPVASIQHGSMPLSGQLGALTTQQNLMTLLQSGSAVDQVQGSSFNPLQQGAMDSRQNGVISGQNTINIPQQPNPNTMPNTLQRQNLKDLQEQHQQQNLIQTQQMRQQLQQSHMQQEHLMQQQHKQQLLETQKQPLQTQEKQQQTAQMTIHQMLQLHQTNEPNELKVRQTPDMMSDPYLSHYPGGQRLNYYEQFKPGSDFPISSPQNLQASSPNISYHSSQIDQHNLLPSEIKSGIPAQSANSPFAPPPIPLVPSPLTGDTEKPLSGLSPLSNVRHDGIQQSSIAPPQVPSLSVTAPGMLASPLLAEFTSPDNQANVRVGVPKRKSAEESPMGRLIKLVGSSKPNVLSPALNNIASVISMVDRIAGSAPGNDSRAAVGEDLVAMTKYRLEARNFESQDRTSTSKKMKHDTIVIPYNVPSTGSFNENVKQFCGLDTSELDSTATSGVKQEKTEANHALHDEIGEINLRLIDTVIEIIKEDADSITDKVENGGTLIKIFHTAVSLTPSLKSHFASSDMSPILPLRLFVPASYPRSSPVVLDKLPDEPIYDSDDWSVKAKSRFSISLRNLSEPMSLKDMVKRWDACVRIVIIEYAEKHGGCFSSRYCTWETA